MYRVAVCDDEQADAVYVENCIKKWASDHAVMVHVEMFPSAEAFWFRYEEDRTFDILFLDIEMKVVESGVVEPMNGIELAAKIRERDHAVQIVFVTGYMDYIAEGYDVEALHYLLKPVTPERLGGVLDRAVQRAKYRDKELCLHTAEGMVCIPAGSIRYLEVRKNYVTIYAEEPYTVKKTLGELEKELDERFFRTGRSYIVNLLYIKKITKSWVCLKDGTQVPLSRGLYEEINRAVIRYF